MDQQLSIPINLVQVSGTKQIRANSVNVLPQNGLACVLTSKSGSFDPGLYYRDRNSWTLVLPQSALDDYTVNGGAIDVYAPNTASGNVAGGTIYSNGKLIPNITSFSPSGNSIWVVVLPFNSSLFKNGKLTFPDGSSQSTAFNTGRQWVSVLGDGVNSSPYPQQNSANLFFDVIIPGPNNTIFAGGGWDNGANAIVYQYDSEGQLLWSWMDPDSNGTVSAMTWVDEQQALVVAIPGYTGSENEVTRVLVFLTNADPDASPSTKFVPGPASFFASQDDSGYLEVLDIGWKDNSFFLVGSKSGNMTVVGSDIPPGPGSETSLLKIPKSSITPFDGLYPSGNGDWYLKSTSDNGDTVNQWLPYDSVGFFAVNNGNYTTNGSGAADFIIKIDYTTNQYSVESWYNTDNWNDGDTVTILGSKLGGADGVNDLHFVIHTYSTWHYINWVDQVSGTPYTDAITINLAQYSVTGLNNSSLRVQISYSSSSDPFLMTFSDEFDEVQKSPGWGAFFKATHSKYTNSYICVGGAQGEDDGLVTRFNSDGTVAWSVTGMGAVYGMDCDQQGRIFIASSSGPLICLSERDGSKLWETGYDYNAIGGGWDNDQRSVVYKDGYVYQAGSWYTWWRDANDFMVEKIDPATGLAFWSRIVTNQSGQLYQNYNWNGRDLVVNDDGVFIAGYGYIRSWDYYNAAVIKLDLDGGVSYPAFFNPPLGLRTDFTIYGNLYGNQFSEFRVATNDVDVVPRTDLVLSNANITNQGLEGFNAGFGYFLSNVTNLTNNAGIDFGDGAPVANHNPVDVPQTVPFWQDNNTYNLQITDRGNFIRSSWDYRGHIYVNVPSDSEVNFPVGTTITLINMWDWDQDGYYFYVQTYNNDQFGNTARVYLGAQGAGYSPQWGIKGRGTAVLMKIGPNEWLLTGNNIQNTD